MTNIDQQAFLEAFRTDATVNRLVRAGVTAEAIIAALAEEKRHLLKELTKLYVIAPFSVVTPDGTRYVWRCPDHIVPEVQVTPEDLQRMAPGANVAPLERSGRE